METSEDPSIESTESSESSEGSGETPTVTNASQIALAAQNADKIKSGTVTITNFYSYSPNTPNSTTYPFEYGDDTFHYTTKDYSGNTVNNYVIPDGNGGYIPLNLSSTGKLTSGYEDYEKPAYLFSDFFGQQKFFGPEDLLSGVYEALSQNSLGNFTEELGNFSGSYLEFYVNSNEPSRYYEISANYELTDEGALETLSIEKNEYYSYDFQYDAEAKKVTLNEDASATRTIYDVNQVAGERTYVCEYTVDSIVPSDFDLLYEGEVVDEDTTFELEKGETINLDVENIVPATASMDFDEYKIVCDDPDAVGLSANTYSSSMTVSALKPGNFTVTIEGKKVSKTFKMAITEAKPTEVEAYYYINTFDGFDQDLLGKEMAVYEGTPVYIAPEVSPYAASQEVTYKMEGDATGYTMADTTIDVYGGYGEPLPVKEIIFSKAGTYTLSVASAVDPSLMTTTVFTVTEAPSLADVLTGTYMYKEKPGKTANYEVTFAPEAADGTTGTATLVSNEEGAQKTGTYTYAVTNEDGLFEIALTHVSGDELNWDLTIGSDYTLGLYDNDSYYGRTYQLSRASDLFYFSGDWSYQGDDGLTINLGFSTNGTFDLSAYNYQGDYFSDYGAGTYDFAKNDDGTFNITLHYDPSSGSSHETFPDGTVLVCDADFSELTGTTFIGGKAATVTLIPYSY